MVNQELTMFGSASKLELFTNFGWLELQAQDNTSTTQFDYIHLMTNNMKAAIIFLVLNGW